MSRETPSPFRRVSKKELNRPDSSQLRLRSAILKLSSAFSRRDGAKRNRGDRALFQTRNLINDRPKGMPDARQTCRLSRENDNIYRAEARGQRQGGSFTTSQLLLAVTVIIMQRPNATVHREQASRQSSVQRSQREEEGGRSKARRAKGATRDKMVEEMACKRGFVGKRTEPVVRRHLAAPYIFLFLSPLISLPPSSRRHRSLFLLVVLFRPTIPPLPFALTHFRPILLFFSRCRR